MLVRRGRWKLGGSARNSFGLRDPDKYQRILGLATDVGKRLAEKDPDGFVASSSPISMAAGRTSGALAHRPRQRPPLAAQALPRRRRSAARARALSEYEGVGRRSSGP